MLKIVLTIAIAAGLAGLYGTVNVSKKIEDLNNSNKELTAQKEEAVKAKATADSNAKKAKEATDKATKELTSVTQARDEKAREADLQTKRATGLNEQLNKANDERNKAQQALAAWNALGVTPDQVKVLKDDLRKSIETVQADAEERKVLNRNLKLVKDELEKYTGKEEKVLLPEGIRGKVVSVDSNYGFVVVDIGEEQGAKVRGEMIVSRGGQLVGKLRFTTVQAKQSIANILPDFSQAGSEVKEGDIVIRSSL
jgi:hypothetical protein